MSSREFSVSFEIIELVTALFRSIEVSNNAIERAGQRDNSFEFSSLKKKKVGALGNGILFRTLDAFDQNFERLTPLTARDPVPRPWNW